VLIEIDTTPRVLRTPYSESMLVHRSDRQRSFGLAKMFGGRGIEKIDPCYLHSQNEGMTISHMLTRSFQRQHFLCKGKNKIRLDHVETNGIHVVLLSDQLSSVRC
jgi:hypothetical protein